MNNEDHAGEVEVQPNANSRISRYHEIANYSMLVYFGVTTIFFIGGLISNSVFEKNMRAYEDNSLGGLVILLPIFALFVGFPVFVSWIVSRASKKGGNISFLSTLFSVFFHALFFVTVLFMLENSVDSMFSDPRGFEAVNIVTYLIIVAWQSFWIFKGIKRTLAVRNESN